MMIRPGVDMMEALRLTREGRLEEAMAVLQGAPPAERSARQAPERTRRRRPLSTWCRPRSARPEAPGRRHRRRAASDATQLGGDARPPPAAALADFSIACASSNSEADGRVQPFARLKPAKVVAACRGDIREPRLCQRGRQPELQAVCTELLQRRAPAAGRDAARLYPVARRLRCRDADERVRRGARFLRCLSGAAQVGQSVQMLELVRGQRAAARPRRALADRGNHAPDRAGFSC